MTGADRQKHSEIVHPSTGFAQRGVVILVVDNTPRVRYALEEGFAKDHPLFFAATWDEGLRLYYELEPALVLLGVDVRGLPDWETCRALLGKTRVPIVFLASYYREDDAIRALRLGAVDYVSKTVPPQVLLARTRAALRRNDIVPPELALTVYEDDYLCINMASQEVFVAGRAVQLTTTEYKLLAFLVQRTGRMCSKDQILRHIWGEEYEGSYHYVHLYVGRLRRKIESAARGHEYFVSVYGKGYCFQAAPDVG